MGADAVRGPVPDRSYPEIVLGDAEALLDLPEPVVVRQHFGRGRVAQIGDDTGQPVPSLRFGDLLRLTVSRASPATAMKRFVP